jgi:type IV secretion system protein VirB9
LFIKPQEPDVQTSLIVVTDRRTYVFLLKSRREGDPSQDSVLRFTFEYPEEEQARREQVQRKVQEREDSLVDAARALRPEQLNFAYGFSGDAALVPELLFDDGVSTFFRFTNSKDLPAIFVVERVDADKREALANYHVEGPYVIVHRVAEQFSLRVGGRLACIRSQRKALPDVAAGVNAPRQQKPASGLRRWVSPVRSIGSGEGEARP